MTRLSWLNSGNIEFGLDRGVLYPKNAPGVSWQGLIAVTQEPATASEKIRYIDGVKVGKRLREDSFSGSVSAFTYPDELLDDRLSFRRGNSFGMSYRTMRNDGAYAIHIVYNVSLRSSSSSYILDDTSPFTWNFTTTPIVIPGGSRTAHLIIDTSIAYSWVIEALEDILYGSEATEARLPDPQEVWDLVEENSIVRVIDNGDGSFTVIGPDEYVKLLDETSFEISWPSAIYLDEESYRLSSL